MSDATLDLHAKYGESTFSNYEVFMLGETLVRSMATVFRMGHASPASSLDYLTEPRAMDLGTLILRDYIAWTSGRTDMAPGCVERIRELVETSNIEAELLAGLAGQTPRSAKRAS